MFRFALVSGVAGNWLLVFSAVAQAHGGVPILQVGPERVNPGGTIELVGDMTQEGPVAILIVAPAAASVRSLAVVETDHEGHFRTFLTVPSDLSTGRYMVRAAMEIEDASAPIEVVGVPLAGEAGQLPGQDEARAPIPDAPGAEPGAVVAVAPAAAPAAEPGGNGILAVAAGGALIAVGVALLIGWIARSKAGPRATSG